MAKRTEIIGLDEWNSWFDGRIDFVETETKKTISKRGKLTERDAKKLAAVDTGFMRDGIDTEIEDGGFTAVIGVDAINPENGFDYSLANEFGTSKMAAQPFMVPAFENQSEKLEQDLSKIVKKIDKG